MTQIRHQKIHSTQNGDYLNFKCWAFGAQTLTVANTHQVLFG